MAWLQHFYFGYQVLPLFYSVCTVSQPLLVHKGYFPNSHLHYHSFHVYGSFLHADLHYIFFVNTLPKKLQILFSLAPFLFLLTLRHDFRCFIMLCLYFEAVAQSVVWHLNNPLFSSRGISLFEVSGACSFNFSFLLRLNLVEKPFYSSHHSKEKSSWKKLLTCLSVTEIATE